MRCWRRDFAWRATRRRWWRSRCRQRRAGEVDVREVGRGELDVFLDTMNVGFDQHAAMLANLRRNQSFWCDVPDWHLFLARVDGAPAGAAVLSIHGDIGYLAAGSVLPQFRGARCARGVDRGAARSMRARGTAGSSAATRRGDRRASATCSAPVSRWRT